jgi:hypothetical protein
MIMRIVHFDINVKNVLISSKNHEESGLQLGFGSANHASCPNCMFHILGAMNGENQPLVIDELVEVHSSF